MVVADEPITDSEYRNTDLIVTVGPEDNTQAKISFMLDEGMDIARFELNRLNEKDFANRILHFQYIVTQTKAQQVRPRKIMVEIADPT